MALKYSAPMADPHRNSSADWSFPFPAPGRPRPRSLPARTSRRWPFADPGDLDPSRIPARPVRAPISASELKRRISEFADDVGLVHVDHPALAHEREEIRWVFPHARTLVVLVSEENRAGMQSRYLPSANHALYQSEERLFAMGDRTLALVRSLGGSGLTTTVGWPQEVSQRWADKIWPLSHRLVAQAAGLGVIGTSRNFLHRTFGAYCLLDTALIDLEFDAAEYDRPQEWNPCLECNLCVASCPTGAIRSDGDFDFFACYNHTYRDSIPGFMDLVHDLGAARPRRFRRRWSDAEIAALWQSLAFRVEYRCFNCVATCPSEMHEQFHSDRAVRRSYVDHTMKPLARTRSEVDEQFVIDTPSVRDRLAIPPGRWRTPPDEARPSARGVRLVQQQRIRTSNVDSMMRNMPHYFRASESTGLRFACQLDLEGPEGGKWVIRVAEERCTVEPGTAEAVDLVVRAPARLFLAIHRGERSAVAGLLLGRIRLSGRRRLFLAFPRLFGATPAAGWHALALWHLRRALRRVSRRAR